MGRPGRCAARSYASISRCERVLYVGDAVFGGGGENAQNANLNVARDTRTLTLIGIGRPNGLVELGREELEYR